MYGINTINSLNRKNAEAAAILAKHQNGQAKPAPTPTMFAPVAKINQLLEGTKG